MKPRRLIPYFMMATLLPVILIGSVLIGLSIRELKVEQGARRSQALEKIHHQTLDQVETFKNILKLASTSRDLMTDDSNRKSIYLKNILNQFSAIRSLRIYSASGHLLQDVTRPGVIKKSAPLIDPFKAPTYLQGRLIFQGPIHMTDEGYPFVPLACILTSPSNEPTGYLLADISLERLSQTLNLLPFDAAIWEGNQLVAATESNRILNQKNVIPAKAGIQGTPEASSPHVLGGDPIKSIKHGFPIKTFGNDEFNIPELGWTIELAEPFSRVYRPAILLFLRLAVGILLIALLSLYVGMRLSGKAEVQIAEQERLAAIGQMASAVGHEIRTALSVIKNSVNYLKERLGGSDAKLERHLDIIETEIKASNQILSDILNFSQHRDIQLKPILLNSLLDQVVENLQVPPAIRVKKYYEADGPLALINEVEFKQVVSNVILNALQAMGDSGTLILKTLYKKDVVSVIIQDTGGGIDPAIQKKIMDPFFTTKSQGMGLGLSISKKVMDRHGGTIKILSRVGEGTTVELGFKRFLPLSYKGEARRGIDGNIPYKENPIHPHLASPL